MRFLLPTLVLALVFLSGCARTAELHELDDLLTIAHNEVTDYTLLVYRNPNGTIRRVLRRKGVCEMMLIETMAGDYYLKERGETVRKLEPTMISAVKSHLHELVYNKSIDQELTESELSL